MADSSRIPASRYLSPELFRDKIVLITGGGSGIGMATTQAFLDCGATVLIASRNEERLAAAAEKMRSEGDGDRKVDWVKLDIRELEQIEDLANFIKEKYGRLDILVNNAGGQFPSTAESIKPKGWDAVIRNNLNGTWYLTQSMANHFFIPQKSGNIVNVIANVFRGFPGMAHTGAARAGVENLTKSLAVEWAPYQIRINAVAPGIIKSTGLEQYPPALLQGIASSIPMKRLGTVDEVAWSALFLASPLAAYTSGETIYQDGAMRLWGSIWKVPDPAPAASADSES